MLDRLTFGYKKNTMPVSSATILDTSTSVPLLFLTVIPFDHQPLASHASLACPRDPTLTRCSAERLPPPALWRHQSQVVRPCQLPPPALSPLQWSPPSSWTQ